MTQSNGCWEETISFISVNKFFYVQSTEGAAGLLVKNAENENGDASSNMG